MNDGKFRKIIFTSSNSTNLIVDAFAKSWKHGWIEHIRLQENSSYLIDSKKNDFFGILVIDSDVPSLNLVKSIVGQLENTDSIEVILLAETHLNFEQIEIVSVIEKNLINSCVRVVSEEALITIIECYAHLLCGFSYTCLDFNDIHEWLHAGTTFLSSGSYIDLAVKNELPYMLYLQLAELKAKYEKLDLEVAAINLVFLGAYISQDLFAASLAVVSGYFDRDLNLTVHSNIQEANQNGKVGFKIFASLTKKSINTLHSATDVPVFLRG